MDGALRELADTVSRLEVVLASGQLAQCDTARCQLLANALRKPARICFVGTWNTDLIPMVEAALNCDRGTLHDMPEAFEIRGGANFGFEATLADGEILSGTDWPGGGGGGAAKAAQPVFLRLQHPIPVLDSVSFLVLTLDRNTAQHGPALAWAARRSDIGVFCVKRYGIDEARIWNAFADGLRDHGYLLECESGAEAAPGDTPSEFIETYRSDPANIDEHIQDLMERLLQDVQDARQADLDATRLFLHRRGIEATQVSVPAALAPKADDRQYRIAELSEPLLYLIGRAKALSQDLAWMTEEDAWATHILAECCETAEGLCDRAALWSEDDPVMRALGERVEAMRDTLTLLEVEGGARPASKAAALMEQIRSDIETALDPSGSNSSGPL